ncbi:helicase [Yersinia enterocolitica]|nr:helicase [Yersinia enterocolitica]
MHSIQGNLRKNGEFINNQGGALLHHNSPIPWSTFAGLPQLGWWKTNETY